MTDAQRVERYLVADGFKRGASQPVAGAVKMVGRRNGRACTFWIQSHADTVRVCRVGATLETSLALPGAWDATLRWEAEQGLDRRGPAG